MRVQYNFSSRRTGRIGNMRRQRQKYPNIIDKIIETSDIILEILDARYIEETRNLTIEEQIKKQNKKIIYVINKSDLIETKKLKEMIPTDLRPFSVISATSRIGAKTLRDTIKRQAKLVETPTKKILRKYEVKTSKEEIEKVTIGVIGYPNTGKSSVINLLIGKSSAGVGSDAGFTRGVQKLNLSKGIVLIDSPGVIPREEYSHIDMQAITRHTKVGGRSYSQVKDPEIVIANIFTESPKVLQDYYKIDGENDSEIFIEKLGRQKGFLLKGGIVDTDKTARQILKDWQSGKIKIN
jgi:hypothetical protein